ncbi:MAG: class I SAM-dependent methyltransferase [Deltaproteobacteria bacterium]|nr:class I SAM-dependent methyltransferase [Deltaproteobacteria bacterium]
MKILVAIANHGTKNAAYLQRLLQAYRSLPFEVRLVVLSDLPKDLGPDVEVVVGAPTRDPWSLPFGHKAIFAEQADRYDLFIYSEDDTLINQRNIEAFQRVSEVLPEDRLAGFMRYEVEPGGKRTFSTVHSHFHWVPSSLEAYGGLVFASFTNEHSACYLLLRRHLQQAIRSGGFLVPPHSERYDLLVTAATDPYTQCGFKKVVCVSELEDFVLHHLPNQYLGRMGLDEEDFSRQVSALLNLNSRPGEREELFTTQTNLYQSLGSRNYYEPCRQDILQHLPGRTGRVLSIGCGWAATEKELLDRGYQVAGIPLDAVIGACARARGIETTPPGFEAALQSLVGETFDLILISEVLQFLPDPAGLLAQCASLLAPGGLLTGSVANFDYLGIWRLVLEGKIPWECVRSFDRAGVHFSNRRKVVRWFKAAGYPRLRLFWTLEERNRSRAKVAGGLLNRLFASHLVFQAAGPGSGGR